MILVGDSLEVLATLADGSVDCCVTSPPYFGLRDYGTGAWEPPECEFDGRTMEPTENGGWACRWTAEHPADRANIIEPHEHKGSERWYTEKSAAAASGEAFSEAGEANAARLKKARWREAGTCVTCGATRVDRQIGLEPTLDEYVAKLVGVFREVRRVLAPYGTCWVNLGDSYAGSGKGAWDVVGPQKEVYVPPPDGPAARLPKVQEGTKPKDLLGVPWRVAFALQADGWWLRSDIVWAKPNPMPESVTDRPTKAHEYVFLLTKQPRYWFDQEAVREPHKAIERPNFDGVAGTLPKSLERGRSGGDARDRMGNGDGTGRNVRSVWQIATEPYPDAHFATFPVELARRCVVAGCAREVCRVCGKARERIVEREPNPQGINGGEHREPARNGALGTRDRDPACEARIGLSETLGWSDCGHDDYRPGVVFDPFAGSGTTGVAALRNHREFVGIELNPEYAKMAETRIANWHRQPARPQERVDGQEALWTEEAPFAL